MQPVADRNHFSRKSLVDEIFSCLRRGLVSVPPFCTSAVRTAASALFRDETLHRSTPPSAVSERPKKKTRKTKENLEKKRTSELTRGQFLNGTPQRRSDLLPSLTPDPIERIRTGGQSLIYALPPRLATLPSHPENPCPIFLQSFVVSHAA